MHPERVKPDLRPYHEHHEHIPETHLHFRVGTDRIDLSIETLHALHLYQDGTVDEATIVFVDLTGNANIRIWLEVPGFSRYSLGH